MLKNGQTTQKLKEVQSNFSIVLVVLVVLERIWLAAVRSLKW
jgi:hypothetical protein